MLERINKVVDGLYDSLQPRADVCDAAREISEASVAVIFEPGPNSGRPALQRRGRPGHPGR